MANLLDGQKRSVGAPAAGRKPAKKQEQGMRKILFWWAGGIVLFVFASMMLKQYYTSTEAPVKTDADILADAIKEVAENERKTSGKRNPWALGIKRLSSSDPGVRVQGMEIIASTDPAKAGPILRGLLADPFPQVRAKAAQLLANYRIAGSGVHIARLLSDNDASVRQTAIAAVQPFLNENGIMFQLATPLQSRDRAVVQSMLPLWQAALPQDRQQGVMLIQRPLMSQDTVVVSAVLTVMNNSLTLDELRRLRPILENIKRTYPNQEPMMRVDMILARL